MSNAALLLDYLFLGELIQARLREQVPGLAAEDAVQGIESLAQALERNISAPTAYVLWEGELFDTGPQGSAMQGASQLVRQQWTVLLAMRHAAQHQPDARNRSAGPLLALIHKALAGWRPENSVRSFRRAQGRRPVYQPNVGLYPLTFEIPLHL